MMGHGKLKAITYVSLFVVVLVFFHVTSGAEQHPVTGFKTTFLSVDENAGNVPVCVFMRGIVTASTTVNITSDSNAITSPPSVTFAANQRETCFNLVIHDNTRLEYNKTAHLTLFGVDNPKVLINETQKQLEVFIRDDDQVIIQFEKETITVEEDVAGGKAELVLMMLGVTEIPFHVKLVVNQDGTDTAKDGRDFNILAKDVIFTHGKQRITIRAYIEDDDDVEQVEFFTVKIVIPTETRALVGHPSKALVKIEDSSDIEKAQAVAAKLESEESNDEKSANLLMTILVVTGSFFGIALTVAILTFVIKLWGKKRIEKTEDEEDEEDEVDENEEP